MVRAPFRGWRRCQSTRTVTFRRCLDGTVPEPDRHRRDQRDGKADSSFDLDPDPLGDWLNPAFGQHLGSRREPILGLIRLEAIPAGAGRWPGAEARQGDLRREEGDQQSAAGPHELRDPAGPRKVRPARRRRAGPDRDGCGRASPRPLHRAAEIGNQHIGVIAEAPLATGFQHQLAGRKCRPSRCSSTSGRARAITQRYCT